MNSYLFQTPPSSREISQARRLAQMVALVIFAFASALVLTFVVRRGSLSPWVTHVASWMGGCGMLIAGVTLLVTALGLDEYASVKNHRKVERVFGATEQGRSYLGQLRAQGRQPVRGELKIARQLARSARWEHLKNTFLKAILKS